MKTLNKIEKCIVTVVCAAVLWLTMFIGAYYLCYDAFDMYYDESLTAACVYSIATGYWLIKKIVFRFIEIIKSN